MSDKPTGVFVRLPLSGAQINSADAIAKEIAENNAENEWRFARHHFASCDNLVRSMGTPVTGGKEICSGIVKWHENDIEPTLETYVPNAFGRGTSVKIVTLSDHQAQIAALEAEVVRLREVIEEIELGIDALSSEEDDGGRITSSEMKRQALEVVRSEVKALKGGAA